MAAVEKEEEKQNQASEITLPLDEATITGLIVKFSAWLEEEGYPETTTYPNMLRVLANHGANLLNPEHVKKTIGKIKVKNGSKMVYTCAYDTFCKMQKITWAKPFYKQEETLPFVPEEKELDMLIAGTRSRRMSIFLQTLKETYADPGEVLRLRWIDLSEKENIVIINNPVKGHLPGQIPVSNKLIPMLNSLPQTSERIFPTKYSNIANCFIRVRKRLAEIQKNPRFNAIQLRSFRHWGGSMIAHYTNGNVLIVKKLLRHKRIENTMKYITMLNIKDDEFDVTTATTLEEIKQVAAAGFQKYDEINGIHVYRRPKRFGGLKSSS